MKDPLRVPPQQLETERALLGAIMIKPDVLHDLVDIVSADGFYAEKHRIIYRMMIELYSKNEPIDLLSVTSKLKDHKLLDNIGGVTYLSDLVSSVPAASNAEHYAHIVQKKFMLRGLIEAGEYIAELGYDEAADVEETLDRAEKKVYEITNTPTLHKFVSLASELTESWARLESLAGSTDEIRGVKTGFPQLDNLLAGLQKSDLIILAARPSMGKTALALDIARQASVANGTVVGMFSLEMSSQQLVDRMVSAEAKVNSWNLRTGKGLGPDDYEKIRDSYDRLSKAPIFIDDKAGNNILNMRAVARRLKREQGLGLIVVDYLQLMMPTNNRNSDNMVQQVTEISRSLKQLARELDVPVLALSQLSRAVETRRGRPRLSDLRDSGSIEQDADVVMFIHREDKMTDNSDRPNIAEILVEKHRNGPVGKVELYFDDKRTTFLSLEKSNINDFETTIASTGDF